MHSRAIGYARTLVLGIACSLLAACPSKTGTNGNSGTKGKGGAGHSAQTDGGAMADAAAGDAGPDAATAGHAGSGGGGGTTPIKLTKPPASYACTFGSDSATGHGYWFCATKTRREPARMLCKDLGADFVIIDDAQENSMVQGKITDDAYIGYSDALTENMWIWVDGTKGSYTNWDTKQPTAADFALIEKSNGKWQATTDVALGFVCEGAKLKQP